MNENENGEQAVIFSMHPYKIIERDDKKNRSDVEKLKKLPPTAHITTISILFWEYELWSPIRNYVSASYLSIAFDAEENDSQPYIFIKLINCISNCNWKRS